MQGWKATGRALAVVSNNSTAAVETYLDIHNLRARVDQISARTSADVALLKPSPFLLTAAATRLRVPLSQCVLIGDSATDIEAAHAAKATAIGYANKPGKASTLKAYEPDAITTSMNLSSHL
jgi:HAD superfamily hydrolase (TIGR01509 family)